MRYRITTPEPGYTGVSAAGVNFTKGVAEIDAPPPLERLVDGKELRRQDRAERDAVANDEAYRTVAYFRDAGYGVEEVDDTEVEVEAPEELDAEQLTALLAEKNEELEQLRADVQLLRADRDHRTGTALPAKSASKPDWVNAAVARAVAAGEDEAKARAAAEALTKEQLIELLTPKGEHE